MEPPSEVEPPPLGVVLVLLLVVCLRRRVEFQWFLMALSVRPGSMRAMEAHLLPWMACAATMARSSSSTRDTDSKVYEVS